MTATIKVSREFKNDFNEYCKLYDMNSEECDAMRNAVRANFDVVGAWITRQIAVYKWMVSIWGKNPEVEWLDNYLLKNGVNIDVSRYGIMMLAGICYDVTTGN